MSKDYLDLAALLQGGVELESALAAGAALYREQFNPMITLRALSYFGDGDLPRLPEEVKRLLSEAACRVRTIPALPRRSDRLVPGV